MPYLAMNAGAFLLVLGILGYVTPALIGSGDPYKPTALIPSAVGLLLEFCGVISISKPGLRKHLMHFAAMIGLLGTIGGLVPMFRSGFDMQKAATRVGLGMTVICLIFTGLCIGSFIAARKARQAAAKSV
ncbi:MAG: hypothetical protein U0798_20325 [Gemmataceae bacterium]